jgi:hypothetical protein
MLSGYGRNIGVPMKKITPGIFSLPSFHWEFPGFHQPTSGVNDGTSIAPTSVLTFGILSASQGLGSSLIPRVVYNILPGILLVKSEGKLP